MTPDDEALAIELENTITDLQRRIAAAEADGRWNDAIQLKAQWQGVRKPFIDQNGFYQPPSAPPPPGTEPPPPAPTRVPVDELRPGGPITEHRPSPAEQIAAAEQAGDWTTAMALKSQQLARRHKAIAAYERRIQR